MSVTPFIIKEGVWFARSFICVFRFSFPFALLLMWEPFPFSFRVFKGIASHLAKNYSFSSLPCLKQLKLSEVACTRLRAHTSRHPNCLRNLPGQREITFSFL